MLDVKEIQARIEQKHDRIRALEGTVKELGKEVADLTALLPRAKAVQWGMFMARNEPTIHYSQARPTPQYPKGTQQMTLDCSGMCETIARWSGLKDPSGLGWGVGNTDSMLRTLEPIPRRRVQPADYAIWHNGTDGLHVATVVQVTDTDIQIVSHGQEAGPALYWLSGYTHTGTLSFLSAV